MVMILLLLLVVLVVVVLLLLLLLILVVLQPVLLLLLPVQVGGVCQFPEKRIKGTLFFKMFLTFFDWLLWTHVFDENCQLFGNKVKCTHQDIASKTKILKEAM